MKHYKALKHAYNTDLTKAVFIISVCWCMLCEVVACMFAREYGLAHVTIGGVMRTVLSLQDKTELATEMLKYLSQGLTVPDELAIQCLEVVLLNVVCSTRG